LSESVGDWLGRQPTADPSNGLIVQGGGMRGVYSMGALTALEDAGLSEAFGLVVGSSAGAINAAYFLAGQAHQAVGVYIDHLSNRKFVNPLRAQRIVDIDFLVDTVLKKRVPLDLDAIRRSSCTLEVILTDALTAQPFVVTNRDTEVDFYEVMRATAALPALYNRRIDVNGRLYVDGGAADTVPVMRALDGGARRLLAVVTRAPGFRRTTKRWPYRVVARALARGQSRAVKGLIGVEDKRFNEAMDLLERGGAGMQDLCPWVVWPSDSSRLVGRTTFDKERLRVCAEMGRADMNRILEGTVDGSCVK
jgi:predicted patatin/cPLA2 family phospholipase